MQRDRPSATSMVSFPQSGNQLFTRRWMPWYALAWKPRSLARYPWTADGTAAPRKLAGLCHFPPLAVQHAPTQITPVWRDHKIRREAGARSGPWRVTRGPWRVQITRPLPRSLVKCLPDRGLWSPSPSCDALAFDTQVEKRGPNATPQRRRMQHGAYLDLASPSCGNAKSCAWDLVSTLTTLAR
jgi:hypothetical protein